MYSWRSGWPPASRWTEEYDFLLQSGSCVRRFFRPWLCTSFVGFLFSTFKNFMTLCVSFASSFQIVVPEEVSLSRLLGSFPFRCFLVRLPLPCCGAASKYDYTSLVILRFKKEGFAAATKARPGQARTGAF